MLGRLRARRGEPGAAQVLDEACALAAKTGELQYIWPAVATADPPEANCYSSNQRAISQTVKHVSVEVQYHFTALTPFIAALVWQISGEAAMLEGYLLATAIVAAAAFACAVSSAKHRTPRKA